MLATAAHGAPARHRTLPHDPSGVPMPVGNLRGWKQVFKDDFTGTTLDPKWVAYTGVIGGGQGGWWSPSHTLVRNGELVLRTYRDPASCKDAADCALFNDEVSAGVKSRFSARYGRFEVRMRTAPTADVSVLALLWPTSDQAPPETDFGQVGGPAHLTTIGAELKYPAAATGSTGASGPTGATGAIAASGATPGLIQDSVSADAAKWHTLGVVWSAGKVVYTLDGRPWATELSPEVGSVPMNIVIQAQTDCESVAGQTCSAPWAATEPDVDVAWVVAYRATH